VNGSPGAPQSRATRVPGLGFPSAVASARGRLAGPCRPDPNCRPSFASAITERLTRATSPQPCIHISPPAASPTARSPPAPARAARSGAALTAQEAQVARIPPGRASSLRHPGPSPAPRRAKPWPVALCTGGSGRGPAQLTIAGTQSPDQGDLETKAEATTRSRGSRQSLIRSTTNSVLDARETNMKIICVEEHAIDPATDKAARPAVPDEAPYFGLMDAQCRLQTVRLSPLPVHPHRHRRRPHRLVGRLPVPHAGRHQGIPRETPGQRTRPGKDRALERRETVHAVR
jgi:hypothetical protein